ncbi:hypothetical protein SRB5_17130 [Streptomyces sp. RB5]|uniref:Helix-hairpin-helix domain-containing protein n=1 Tax=Streptomyces smaragdinus TaxID=2585196 RepID=A0A7K0CFS7_9ACTN|nr:hypothetical protein [Streptomyces smaragdinus]
MDLAGGDEGLHGDPGLGVLGEQGVEYGVADLVGDLVGVALGLGCRGEEAGPVLARHIVEFRTQRGGFTSVAQLREVNGIGPSRFADLKTLVTL